MKKLTRVMALLAALFVLVPVFSSCSEPVTDKLVVVTSTTHLEQLVQRIGGDLVDVVNIVPAASHPGDFDATPNDIKKLADADLFLWHNWPGETYVPGLLESADNDHVKVEAIEIDGNWMTPPVQLQAIDKVAGVLEEVDSEHSATYRKAADDYKKEIENVNTEVRAMLAEHDLSQVNVIAAGWQAGFLNWAGFNVVGTYGLPVPPTVADIENLVVTGRELGVSLVVDNLHDNPDAGKPIATELNCPRVVLYNFPGVDEYTKTWTDTLKFNVDLLLAALYE